LIFLCLCVLLGALARLEAEKLAPGMKPPAGAPPAPIVEMSPRGFIERVLWPMSFEDLSWISTGKTPFGLLAFWMRECGFSPNMLGVVPWGRLAPDPLPPGERQDLLSVYTVRVGTSDRDRARNVFQAAEAVDGAVIPPDGEFSFNNLVGERTVERGFRPGPMFSNGEVVMGIGGGICIVSTALYNLALEANLTILERYPHSGPVTYALPGRDAAVVFGSADLRFRNTTGHPLLIRCYQEKDSLKVALYGTKAFGQTVEILSENYQDLPYKVVVKPDPELLPSEIEEKQRPRPGFEVTTVRVVTIKGKVKRREVISHDRCPPRDEITLISEKPLTGDIFALKSLPLTGPPASPGFGPAARAIRNGRVRGKTE